MKLKNSVKLSALSLSLVALAVTSCGGSKNNDAKKDEKVTTGKTTDPDVAGKGETGETGKPEALKAFDASKVKKLHVNEKLSIPQFGCATPAIEIELEGNKKFVVDPTSEELLVKFVGENSNKFTFEKGQVCAVKTHEKEKTVPAVGDKGTLQIVLKNKSDVRAEAPLEVVKQEVIKAVMAVPEGFTTPTPVDNLIADVTSKEIALLRQEALANSVLPHGYNIQSITNKKASITKSITDNYQASYTLSTNLTAFQREVNKIRDAYIAINAEIPKASLGTGNAKITVDTLDEIKRDATGTNNDHLTKLIAAINDHQNGKVDEILAASKEIEKQLKIIQSAYQAISRNFDSLETTPAVTGYVKGQNIQFNDTNTSSKAATAISVALNTQISALATDVVNYNLLNNVNTALDNVISAQTALNNAKNANATKDVVSVAAGVKAKITVSKIVLGKVISQPLSANDEVVIVAHNGIKLDVKVSPAAPGAKNSTVEFTAPKVVTNGKEPFKILVNGVEGIFSVQVTAAIIDKVSLKGEHVREENGIHYVKFASHGAFDVFAKYTDDSEKQITSVIHTSPINLIVPSSNYQLAKPAAEKVHFTSLNITSGYMPTPIAVTVGSGSSQSVKLYVEKKPLFKDAKVTTPPFNADGTSGTGNPVTSTPVGSQDYNQYCLTLTDLNYALVDIDAASIPAGTASTSARPFTNFSFKAPAKDSGFVIVPAVAGVSEKLCATKTAAPGASIEVGIMYENSVVATSKVSVAQPVLTNTITLSSTRNANGLFTEPVIIVTDASRDIPIELYRLKSDGSVSTTDKAIVGTMYTFQDVDTSKLIINGNKVSINSAYLSSLKPGQTAKMQLKVVPTGSSYTLTTDTEKPSDIITIQYTK
ncbi:MAG: hypothetical protein DCC88_11270 [Spirobacillus cienkowskii]|jgi:hypothetical protein|uniref:Uncharacterized protein n=1 Tax=Spirobacillus cienkowskii TaxID=495820 RepID=A0A369KKT0_9BACT|nr:MAG: hypothetical protein DCC88_11270 [Spirobacillus cienkowskii]